VNCGHPAPIWLQPGRAIARLEPTAAVIGVFEQWDACPGKIQMSPGDLLAVFSDGVTEAAGEEDEFGEDRLIEQLRAGCGLPARQIVAGMLDCIQQFSGGTQSDDLTLLVTRSRLPQE
jgi:serine phosphatase RsbU (regulator of sigma subunit)